ncbi:MAG: helicase-associated domain-containing protein [Chloroflexota bacterium]
MPDLVQSLQGRDIGSLRIVAELWGIDLKAPDARVALQRLAPLLLDGELAAEVVQTLPEGARLALEELLSNEGRLPWALFVRRFGALREMGAAQRDRTRPYENSRATGSEALWYRALIARTFFDTPNGPEEFAYIPDDLLALLPLDDVQRAAPLGRPATPAEKAYQLPAGDRVLDDAATLLAALRMPAGDAPAELDSWLSAGPLAPYALSPAILKELLRAAGLLDRSSKPLPEPARLFLEAERGQALARLAQSWLGSPIFNELRLLPSLAAEGAWRNDPLAARRSVLDFLSSVPGWISLRRAETERPFWSLAAFVSAVRSRQPDYQRPAGDYDSWYLRPAAGGEYLRGFEHWDAIDGELLRFIICGPMYWLGLVDLAFPAAPDPAAGGRTPASAFRFSAWAADLLNLKAPAGLGVETDPLVVGANGRLHIPARAPRPARYQLARFARWDRLKGDIYHYRLTPASLDAARRQGLTTAQLLSLLRRYAPGVPPALVQALERWEAHGSQARVEQLSVLRVRDPEILAALRATRAARFLGDILGPTVIVVRPGAMDKVLDALAELGYLGETE